MSALTILRTYAQKADPSTLPASVLLTHTVHSLTLFDAYPKSIFHFLVLPRVVPPLTAAGLADLRSVLRGDKARAREVLQRFEEDARGVRALMEAEMEARYGFKWEIWTGFHAVPSMKHVHLHVISADLCSPSMKHKKHYNSFHPRLGFFLHLEDVMAWLDAEPSYFNRVSKLTPSEYEPMLKEPLHCWRCEKEFKNMPTLKAHLQEEFDATEKREKARLERERKRATKTEGDAAASTVAAEAEGSQSKRRHTSEPEDA